MTALHHLQPDLPANLQFVASLFGHSRPWKHLADTDPVEYGCEDVSSVQEIFQRIRKDLAGVRHPNGMSLLEGYDTYVRGIRPILDRMQARGIYIDPVSKAEFREEVQRDKAQLDLEIQDLAPLATRPKKIYTNWPVDCRPVVKDYAESIANGKKAKPVKMAELPQSYRQSLVEYGYDWEGDSLVRRSAFLPNSSNQLKSYFKHFGIPVPKNLDDDETTGKEELKKLIKKLKAGKDEAKHANAVFIEKVISYRELNKIESTYIDGWKVDENNRVHTVFGFAPATPASPLSPFSPFAPASPFTP